MSSLGRMVASLLAIIVLTATAANSRELVVDPGAISVTAHVSKFSIHDATVLDGLAQLSAVQVELSFAFEDILKDRFSDVPVPLSRFNLNLENRTISDILDALCGADPRYAWTRDGLTINVYPRSTVGDVSYLPNRRMSKLELKNITDSEQAVFAVVDNAGTDGTGTIIYFFQSGIPPRNFPSK